MSFGEQLNNAGSSEKIAKEVEEGKENKAKEQRLSDILERVKAESAKRKEGNSDSAPITDEYGDLLSEEEREKAILLRKEIEDSDKKPEN